MKRVNDLTGKKFGRLVAVERDRSKIESYWLCNCECGTKNKSISTYRLIHGKVKSCGCIREEKYNLVGKVFGRLTVVAKSDKRSKNGDVLWECECECGKKQIYHTRNNLMRGKPYRIVSCGCYRREGLGVVNRDENREDHIIKSLYCKLKIRNKKMGFSNDDIIDKDYFCELIKQPCYYCGLVNGNITYDSENSVWAGNNKKVKKRVSNVVLKHNGIDRVDNSKGYTKTNCVPCCKFCNMAKSNMSIVEFLEWVSRVYNYYVLKHM